MKRALLTLALISLSALPSEAARQATTLDRKIATTATKIKAFGTAAPRTDRRVRIRLSHDTGEGYAVVETTRVRVTKNKEFLGAVTRPEDGLCKVDVTYRGVTQSLEFECFRPTFGNGTANLYGDSGPVEIGVEVADTSTRRGYGLMFRKFLPADRGMSFQYASDSSGGYWMRNTLIPLSIAYYDATGIIVDMFDMEPCDQDAGSCPIYEPDSSYRGALEVNQGAFDDWGISEGDVIVVDND